MKPGATILPVASTVSRAASEISPMRTIRPSLTPTSPRYRARPLPSTIVPPVIFRSSISRSSPPRGLRLSSARRLHGRRFRDRSYTDSRTGKNFLVRAKRNRAALPGKGSPAFGRTGGSGGRPRLGHRLPAVEIGGDRADRLVPVFVGRGEGLGG